MTDNKVYSHLAYQLIYPGVLGSMIFDLADPFRDFSLIWVISLLISVCFVVDYLHMNLNLCEDGTAPHKFGPFVDIIIAFLFCISYFSLSHAGVQDKVAVPIDSYINCLLFLSIAHLLIILYEVPITKTVPRTIDMIPILPPILGGIFLKFPIGNIDPIHTVLVSVAAMLIFYCIRTFNYKGSEKLAYDL